MRASGWLAGSAPQAGKTPSAWQGRRNTYLNTGDHPRPSCFAGRVTRCPDTEATGRLSDGRLRSVGAEPVLALELAHSPEAVATPSAPSPSQDKCDGSPRLDHNKGSRG